MKKTTACLALALSLLSAPSFAFPDKEEMSQNYQTCVNSDPSWYNRWGAYLVSFDRDEAYAICRSYWHNANIKPMACKVDGQWLYAGYYCYFE